VKVRVGTAHAVSTGVTPCRLCDDARTVIFRQLIHDDLGCASYLIGDEDEGVAAVVDPRFEIDEYLQLARYMGVSIEHIFETHNHADHVSGHGRLAAATGASIHIHRDAGADYPHEPFEDADELSIGTLTVRVLHTPGHRPEHCAFALIDTARADGPWAVLTGDSLFVGDVAPGHIPGSTFTPWHDIAELPAGLDRTRPIAVLCASGQRAATAASLVQRFGAEQVIHVVGGGVPKWERLGHPIEGPSEAGAVA